MAYSMAICLLFLQLICLICPPVLGLSIFLLMLLCLLRALLNYWTEYLQKKPQKNQLSDYVQKFHTDRMMMKKLPSIKFPIWNKVRNENSIRVISRAVTYLVTMVSVRAFGCVLISNNFRETTRPSSVK